MFIRLQKIGEFHLRANINPLLVCPVHKLALKINEQPKGAEYVGECGCTYQCSVFDHRNLPVLIHSELQNTVFEPEFLSSHRVVDGSSSSMLTALKAKYAVFRGIIENAHEKPYVSEVVRLIGDAPAGKKRCLIVGSGNRNLPRGLNSLNIEVIGFDLFCGSSVDFIADAHDMPLASDTFDMVFVQAVLEHVVEPHKVVDEIYRVLKNQGIVVSEVPFLQGIHEGAYDFYRFTPSAHVFLFRRFQRISHGILGGATLSFVWALRGFIENFTGRTLAKILTAPFFIISQMLRTKSNRANWDNANSTYFVGRKTSRSNEIKKSHKEALKLYLQ